jgi:hypothetical protein
MGQVVGAVDRMSAQMEQTLGNQVGFDLLPASKVHDARPVDQDMSARIGVVIGHDDTVPGSVGAACRILTGTVDDRRDGLVNDDLSADLLPTELDCFWGHLRIRGQLPRLHLSDNATHVRLGYSGFRGHDLLLMGSSIVAPGLSRSRAATRQISTPARQHALRDTEPVSPVGHTNNQSTQIITAFVVTIPTIITFTTRIQFAYH